MSVEAPRTPHLVDWDELERLMKEAWTLSRADKLTRAEWTRLWDAAGKACPEDLEQREGLRMFARPGWTS